MARNRPFPPTLHTVPATKHELVVSDLARETPIKRPSFDQTFISEPRGTFSSLSERSGSDRYGPSPADSEHEPAPHRADPTLTFSGMPVMLHNSFRFNEALLSILPTQQKPFRCFTADEVVAWLDGRWPAFAAFVRAKGLSGKRVRRLGARTLVKHGLAPADAAALLARVQEVDRATSFGRLLHAH